MEITADNWLEGLELIREDLGDEHSVFCAIDFEFLGPDQPEPIPVMTAEHRYQSAIQSIGSRAIICQVGLCIVKECDGQYVAQCYSIYQFPGRGTQGVLAIKRSSAEFLMKHDFNFNKFMNGVSCMTPQAISKLLAKHQGMFDPPVEGDQYREPTGGKARLLDEVKAFLAIQSPVEGVPDSEFFSRVWSEAFPLSSRYSDGQQQVVSLKGNGFSGVRVFTKNYHERKVVADYVRYVLADQNYVYHYIPHGPYEDVEVYQLSPAGVELWNEAVDVHRENEFCDAAGVTILAQEIVQSGLPLVGHNCMTDTVMALCQYSERPPRSLGALGLALDRAGISIFDTKVMAKQLGFPTQKTWLSRIFGTILSHEFFEVPLPFDVPDKERSCLCLGDNCSHFEAIINLDSHSAESIVDGAGAAAHDAGFDAYMTAYVFTYLAQCFPPPLSDDSSVHPLLQYAAPVRNRINSHRHWVPYISVGSSQPYFDRTNAYRIHFDSKLHSRGTLEEMSSSVPELRSIVSDFSRVFRLNPSGMEFVVLIPNARPETLSVAAATLALRTVKEEAPNHPELELERQCSINELRSKRTRIHRVNRVLARLLQDKKLLQRSGISLEHYASWANRKFF